MQKILYCFFSFFLSLQFAHAQFSFHDSSSELSLSSYQRKDALSLNMPLSLEDDTSNKKTFLRKAIIPTALIGIGFFTLKEEGYLNKIDIQNDINRKYPDFFTDVDDYTQLVPIFLTYGMQWCGNDGKNDFINKTLLLIKSEAITLGLVHLIKHTSKLPRPDTGARTSFPSGHTAQAFVAATFMHKEYGHKSVWYSIAGYTFAGATGILRVLNNRHYVSDVFVGAGMGILITEFVYKTHKFRWGADSRTSLSIVPAINPNYQGFALSIQF